MHLLRIIKCSIIIYNAHLKKKKIDSLDYAMHANLLRLCILFYFPINFFENISQINVLRASIYLLFDFIF